MAIGLEHDFEEVTHPEDLPIPRQVVLRAMSHVLDSKPFRTSKQCQNFLRYVVLNTVDGRDEALKERVIGAAVLERPHDYNTSDDPVVRIRAADVRKRLAMYYQEEGQDDPIRITIPSGSYRVFLHHAEAHPVPPVWHADPVRSDAVSEHLASSISVIQALGQLPAEAPHPVAVEAKPGAVASAEETGRWRRRVLMALCIALPVLFGVSMARYFMVANQREFNRFWAPTLDQPRPPIVYVGSNAVYRLSNRFIQHYQATHPDYNGLESLPAIDRTENISGSDLDEDDKDFVGLGDVAAAVSISTFFKGRDIRYDLRFGRDIVFGDFRTTPVVLIGAFNNNWTLELNDKMPYHFSASNGIKRLDGPGHSWQTWYGVDGAPREDYALITREISPKSGEPVIAVAGLDQTGTRAAAEFVSTPALLDAALRKLPTGWQNKKIQLVLHATIVDYVPSGYDVIASSVQ